MAVTEQGQTGTGTGSGGESEQLRRAFEEGPSAFELLRGMRTRRVGLGYRIDSGTTEKHPVTGREMSQMKGPMEFVSQKEPVALTEVEEALLAWAACGLNGIAAWDISLDGGFHELNEIAGRTASAPGNSWAHDLLIINDDGAFIYNPGKNVTNTIEMALNGHAEAGRYDKVLEWYRSGCTQILDERPDIDFMTRIPGVHNATLMGPYQYNINRPGTSWMIPITDAGKLNDAIINFHDAWHMYMIDEWNGGRPAGVEQWIGEGKLELGIPIAAEEQLIFQVEMYPAGIMVQNIKLACEALGLGHWNFCGFNPDILFGAMPDLTRGLGFQVEPPNPKAPISTGQLKVYGIEGVKTATYCPSPQYPTAESLVDAWWESKYGEGRWGDPGPKNLLREAQGMGPWKNDSYVDGILNHPRHKPEPWCKEATTAYIQYCIDNFGQWPVTYNPMQAHFGVVVHHLDTDFYDQHYRPGYLHERHHNHFNNWHGGRGPESLNGQ
jgi:hypothetical protein